jgi:hypothetical protein
MKRLRERGADDRGAVATMVAILLAGGVLLGLAAIVVDTGQLYVEREELQTGADAAALAIAKACAGEADTCRSHSTVVNLAEGYANLNSGDGLSNVAEVCGRLTGVLTRCDGDVGNLTDCLGNVPEDEPYVQVRLSTEVADGLALPPTFAQAMAGNSGFDGASVGACARATWTPPTEIHILGLTMAICDLNDSVRGGFADPDDLRARDEELISLVPGHSTCSGSVERGWSRPNDPAWLSSDGNCEVVMPAGAIVRGDNADAYLNPPGKCETRLRQAITSREIVYVPIHDRTRSSGREDDFHHISLAPFIVTGFYLGSILIPGGDHDERSTLTGSVPCGFLTRCVSGAFVGEPIPVTSVSEDGAVKLIG